ncbi:MAG: holin family protein [Tagaea sp.]|nr:holin family protein [Tagaea sp.]
MIPAILAQVGLPLLVKWVGGALGRVEHPAAKAASDALGQVGEAISGARIPPEDIKEANRSLEALAKLDSDDYRETIRETNATMRVEAQSEDAYVRRMRPTFGYVMALTWAVLMGAVAWIVVTAPGEAAGVVAAIGELSLMWSVGLSVLGVYVYKRSSDKARKAGVEPGNPLEAIGRVFARGKTR